MGGTPSGLLAGLLSSQAPAHGLIDFRKDGGTSGYTHYQVRDDGTGLQALPFPTTATNRAHSTTRSDYPGGRQYLYPSNNNLRVWNQTSRKNKAVTNFHYPYTIGSVSQWSNDGLDSFVSFFLYNSVSATRTIYRAHVSAADLASKNYRPVTFGDPRLERVLDWPTNSGTFHWWNHDGSGSYYPDPRDKTKVRFKLVGNDFTVDDDPIVFVAPAELTELRVIPPVDPMNPVSDRYLVASALPLGTGILAIDLQTSTWWRLDPPIQPPFGGIVRSPCFSPDGLTIAFASNLWIETGTGPNATRTHYVGVRTVPFFGGPVNLVTEFVGTKASYNTVSNWNLP